MALGKRSDVYLWRNSTGSFRTESGGVIRTGLAKGSADLIGIVAPLGKFLALEVKRPGEKPSEAQAHWLGVVRQAGGIAGVVYSVEDALALVESAQQWRGERCRLCDGTMVTQMGGACIECGADGFVWRKSR